MNYFDKNTIKFMKDKGFNSICRLGHKQGLICDICGSGSGDKGTGMTTRDGIHFRCWACGFYGDIFDYVGQWKDIFNLYEQQKEVACLLNINELCIHNYIPTRKNNTNLSLQVNKHELDKIKQNNDYNYSVWANNLKSTLYSKARSYLYQRGLTDNTINHFRLGCTDNNSIIIPVTYDYYIERKIDTKFYKNHTVKCVGTHLYKNFNKLNDNDIVFVCEGVFDGLSVLQCNVFNKIIALNSTSNKNKFYEFVNYYKNKNITYVIQLDNDNAGTTAQAEIYKTLTNNNILCVNSQSIACMTDKQNFKMCKDINECYVIDKEQTKEYLLKAYDIAIQLKTMIDRSYKYDSKKEVAKRNNRTKREKENNIHLPISIQRTTTHNNS